MPLIIANILRSVIVWAIQAGATAVVFAVIERFFDALQSWIRETLGISEDDSRAVVANYVIDAIAFVGAGAAVIYSKAPVTFARKLGLAGGKPVKQKVTQEAEKKIAAAVVTDTNKTSILTKLRSYIIGTGPTDVVMRLMILQNIGDWYFFKNNMVTDLFNTVFGETSIGISSPLKAPGPFSAPEFEDYARSLEAVGIKAIEYGFPKGTILYTRKALAELVDYVYGQQNALGVTVSAIKLKPLLAQYFVFSGAPATAAASLPAAVSSASEPATIKVFTGIVSSGTLGAAQPFTAKEDDMINSGNELRSVAQANAAAFLAALPSKIVYELKVVNSVIASDGTKRVGASVKVPNGKTASGQTKYKYVTNKFAVMSLYLVKKDGARTKITDITLGPTDVANFNPDAQELASIGKNLVRTVATTKTSEVQTIVSDSPISIAEPEVPPLPNYNIAEKVPGDTGYRFYKWDTGGTKEPQWAYAAIEWGGNAPYGRKEITEEEYRRATKDTKDYTNSGYKIIGGILTRDTSITPSPLLSQSQSQPAQSSTASRAAVMKATNLSEYYAALGQGLPSVSTRGGIYESLGLGAQALYTGTVEQNTKLLNALKAKS